MIYMNIITGTLPNSGNYKKGRSAYIKYIVIHYTANKGDTALNNVKYFANNKVSASAHYFVDESNIYTSVPVGDTAWHCGGGKQTQTGGAWYGKCTNSNSIGIEMCLLDKKGNVKPATITNTIKLTKYLMEKYNISASCVIRHWDVVGKHCPAPMIGDNNTYWINFKKSIEEDVDMEQIKILTNAIANLQEVVKNLANPMIYNYIDGNMPEFARPTIQKLCNKGYLNGDANGLGLTYDMLRILVILDRTGAFDKG